MRLGRCLPTLVLGGLACLGAVRAQAELSHRQSMEPGLPGVSALTFDEVLPGPPQAERIEPLLRELFRRSVQAATASSAQLKRQHAEYLAAQSDIEEAKGQRWPQIDVSSRSPTYRYGAGSDINDASTPGLTFNVRTPVFNWGGIGYTVASREVLADAAGASVQVQRENLAHEVLATLLELGKQRLVIDLSQRFEQRMDELVNMLAGIATADPGRASELTQARARLLQAQSALYSARAQADTAQLQLRKLIGESSLQLPATPDWGLRPGNLQALLAQVIDHPGLQRAQSSAEAARLQARAARAAGLPRLDWEISKSTGRDLLGREQPLQTALVMSWGVGRGGSSSASQQAWLYRADAGLEEAQQLRMDLEFGIRTAHQMAWSSLERAELYGELVGETERIRVAFFEQWYHLGTRTLLDVLGAESDHFANQVNEVGSRFEAYQAIVRQYAAAGVLLEWLQLDV